MKYKKALIICAGVYGLTTVFLFMKNMVLAGEGGRLHTIVRQEGIEDADARATLRAFYTAPPVIPHEIEARDSADCLRCHREVTRLDDGRVSMQTPHPQFSNCMQCHVPGQEQSFDDKTSTWKGLEEPKRGDRWFLVSPPTVPHRIKLREDCLSCHGPQNPDMRLRTTHPERTSCLQCHVPDYAAEF